MKRPRWDEALEDYYAEHDRVLTDPDARGPAFLMIGAEEVGELPGTEETGRRRVVRQTLKDPEDHRDWVIEALVDCDASDAAGELVLMATWMGRLGG